MMQEKQLPTVWQAEGYTVKMWFHAQLLHAIIANNVGKPAIIAPCCMQ